MSVETPLETAFEPLKLLLNVETVLETDFEGLKRVLELERGFEVLFGSANEKVHVHAILGLGKKKPASSTGLKFISRDAAS